jgi:arylsulfatase A-like enzyme
VPGDRVSIDWVRVVTQRARYADPPVGRTSLSRGGELRTALHASAPRSLAFAVRVPQDGPRLDLGLGILDAAQPVEFRVEAEQAGTRRELARRRVLDADTWLDLRIDLADFAGSDAVLRLHLSGETGAVGLIATPRITSEPKQRLNVLVVVEDTLRADHLGAWGHDRPTSPHKDRLAREGVVFERAYSQATKTRPSVPSYLTSLLPAATGVWNFHDRLDARYVTLAEVLQQQGFETASFVQNSNAGPAAGVQQGFDRLRSQRTMEFRPDMIYRGVLLDWIAEQRDRNWHAYVHVLDPHGPYDPPAPHDAWHREVQGGTPVERDPRLEPGSVETPTREGRLARYDGEIANNDEWFGGLLKRLDELEIADHTLIVFFSDHGEHLGEHGIWEHSPPGLAPVLHVPLLFWLPARIPNGLRVAEPVSLLDVMPTILALAGVDADRLLLQGRAVLPPGGALAPIVVSEEAIAYERSRPERVRGSVFAGPWQLLYSRYQGTKKLRVMDLRDGTAAARFALPSLRWDPLLERSLLARLRALKRANLELGEAIAHADREVIAMDPEDREQLRALGYIE